MRHKCPNGRACPFSHTKEEQMYHPNVYKTVECMDMPGCPRTFCQFAHGLEELRPRPKTVMSNQAMANTIASVFGGTSSSTAGMPPTGLRNCVPNNITRPIVSESPATPLNSMSFNHSTDKVLLPFSSSLQNSYMHPHDQHQHQVPSKNHHANTMNPFLDSHELFINHPIGFAPPVPSHSMVAPRAMGSEEWVRGSALTNNNNASTVERNHEVGMARWLRTRSDRKECPNNSFPRKGTELGLNESNSKKVDDLIEDIESILKFDDEQNDDISPI